MPSTRKPTNDTSAGSSRTKICFVSPLSRAILEPGFACNFGGAEVRAVHFARGLAERSSMDVSMLLRSYGRSAPQKFDKLTAHYEVAAAPLPRSKDLPRDLQYPFRLLQLKTKKLYRSLRKRVFAPANSSGASVGDSVVAGLPDDILACFGVNDYTANNLRVAKAVGKQVLLFIAHDQDLDIENHREIAAGYGGNASTYRQAILGADHIICQTPHQVELLQTKFERSGTLIRNPVDLHASHMARAPGEYMLWVGRADTFFKRAHLLIALASESPEVPFVAIMNRRNPAVFDELVAQAPANLKIVEHVAYNEIENYYARATALLSTSRGEGFPNSFLQAGKYGRPIVSLEVDPGEMIQRYDCGVLAQGNMEVMRSAITELWQKRNDHRYQQLSASIRGYVENYHALPERIDELYHVVTNLSQSALTHRAA